MNEFSHWKDKKQVKLWFFTFVGRFVSLMVSAIELTKEVNSSCGPLLKEFKAKVDEDPDVRAKIATLKQKVEDFAINFPMPGFDDW